MANILVNGISAKSGGGRSILNNYLNLLKESSTEGRYYIIVPEPDEYQKFKSNNITIIYCRLISKCSPLLPLFYFVWLRILILKYKINVILNFGDIIIPTKTPQVYLFDWAYAIYPESITWARMDFKEKTVRKLKVYLISRYIKLPKVVIAQTDVSRQRLIKYYDPRRIKVIPNAVSLDHLTGGTARNFNLPTGATKLLYLTKYYTHKNIEIFIPLALLIQKQKLPWILIITIDEKQHKNAKRLLNEMASLNLEQVILNVGPIEMDEIPSLYAQSDALLMPTLLESFSGTYVEAMYHGKTILTSDYDFAHEICGDAAYYFDPLVVDTIFQAIQVAFSDTRTRYRKIAEGKQRLDRMLPWSHVFKRTQDTVFECLN